MSSSLASLDDRFGESEHRSFMSRILSFLEYYRKKLSSLVIYIPIGKIIISCFNYLCSFILKHVGFQVEPIIEMDSMIHVGFLEDGKNLEKSEEEKRIEENFMVKMRVKREKVEAKLLECEEVCKEFDEDFETERVKALQEIEELKKKAEKERSSDTDRENTVNLHQNLINILDKLESDEEFLPHPSQLKKVAKELKN